jgi:molybdopterin converting factor small subunit
MLVKINPVNNLQLTIKVDKLDKGYYGEIEEEIKVKGEKIKLSTSAETLDELVENLEKQIKAIYEENKDLVISRNGEDLMGHVLLFNPE